MNICLTCFTMICCIQSDCWFWNLRKKERRENKLSGHIFCYIFVIKKNLIRNFVWCASNDVKYKLLVQLWVLLLWYSKFLFLKVFSQRLQGMEIPSRWFTSMCFFMLVWWPSFLQTLQTYTLTIPPFPFPFIIFSPRHIIVSSCSSSSFISPENCCLGRTTDILGIIWSSG